MNPVYRKSLKQLLVTTVIAAFVFLWGLSHSLTENLYTNGLYPIISACLRTVSGIFPFSLGDVLYVCLIAYVIFNICVFLRKLFKKQLTTHHRFLIPLRVLSFTLILYIAFKLLWGLNYSRPSITGPLGISNKRYDAKELVMLTELIINKMNDVQKLRAKQPKASHYKYSLKQLRDRASQSYHQLQVKQGFFKYNTPSVKPVFNSWMITKIGLEGYYNPLSGEANVNMRLPAADLPFVTAHEIAHQIGVAREDEANLVGYLVATHSDDLNFQYSGYYAILRNLLFEVKLISPESYQGLYNKINKGTLQDYRNAMAFWAKYNNEMFGYMSATLDSFLKINNQQKGIDSYQDIVLWVYNIHEQELKQIKSKTLQP